MSKFLNNIGKFFSGLNTNSIIPYDEDGSTVEIVEKEGDMIINISRRYDVINDIYPNSIEFAEKIHNALSRSDMVIAMAPMQFGKTGMIHYLSNALLSNDYDDGDTTLALTSMSDTALLIQNKASLQDKKFFKDGSWHKSVTFVAKMVPDFRDNTLEYLTKLKVKTVIFDECDYGSSKRSVFNKNLFKLISDKKLPIKLVLVSATPYCAIDAVISGDLNAEIVQAEAPDGYFGVSDMLRLNMVTDINNYSGDGFEPKKYRLMSNDDSLSNEFMTDLDWFIGKESGGLSIIRAESRVNAKKLKELVEEYSDDYEVIAVGVKFTSIKSVLGDDSFSWEHSILHENKKIVLIVINALSAGKDLGNLKKHVRLIVETRKRMIANGSQGLVGRICGYHENRDIRIIASKDILNKYITLERNIGMIQNKNFINHTVGLGLDMSTQLKKGRKSKDKTNYKTRISGPFIDSDVINKSTRLLNLFVDKTFGEFEHLKPIILEGKRSKPRSPMNTQRSRKYKKYPKTFDVIWDECITGKMDFSSRFHRFRSEGNEESRFRIKRGIVINDNTGEFYIIDRVDDGVVTKLDSTIKNTSCYK